MKKLGIILLSGILSTCALVSCGGEGEKDKPETPIISVDPTVTSIEVTKMPNKTVYEELEMFDPTGMIVTAHYNDGSDEELTSLDYLLRPSGPLAPTTTSIRVIDKESEEETIVPITVTPGTPVTSDPQLWIEAENAHIEGNGLTCATAFENSDLASGGVILKNFGRTGNTLSMKVNSTVAGKAKMVFKLCKRPKSAVSFGGMYSVIVNGTAYPIDGTLEAAASGEYFDLTEISGFIYLKAGLNEVVIQPLNDTGSNLDAFGFASDTSTITDGGTQATITHKDTGLYVKTNPTETSKGVYSDGCQICGKGSNGNRDLPMLNDQDYDVDADGIYSITVEGHTFSFGSKVYRFECEDMALGGTVNAGDNKGKPVSVEYNVIDEPNSSGGKCVRYMNTKGNTLTLQINSSRADTASFTVNVAARVNSKGVAFTVPFNEMYEVKVNGNVLQNNVDVVPSVGNNKPLNTSYEWHTLTLGDVNLVSGLNTIVMTAVPRNDGKDTMSAGNLDYVEFTTNGANLSLPE